MPIFEYRCGDCRRRFSLLVGVVAGATEMRCPRCGGEQLQKLISRFSTTRSEDDALDDLADPAKMGEFASPRWLKALAWTTAWIILGLNAYWVVLILQSWM